MLDPRWEHLSYFSIPVLPSCRQVWGAAMLGHAYVESDDAIVLGIISLCFAMYHTDVIDVILSRMTPVNQCHFLNVLNTGGVRMVSYCGLCMVYKIDASSSDATSSSTIAYSIPGLHLYFCFSLSLCQTLSHMFPCA